MNIKDHRLYSYMSEPLRIVGLTVDEVGLGILLLFLCFCFDPLMLKALFALSTPVSIYVVKKLKKVAEGFSLVSFLHWHLGVRSGLSSFVPASFNRRYGA